MLGAVVGLLALHLAAGSGAVTALLALKHRLPAGFLRFSVLGAAVAAGVACVLGKGSSLSPPLGSMPSGRWVLVAALSAWYVNLRLGRGGSRAVSGAVGAVALSALAMEALALPPGHRLPFALGSLTSGFLLGSVTVSMILGHWYLVDPKLSIAPLKAGAIFFAVAVALRCSVVFWTVAAGGGDALRIERASDLIFSTPALFFVFRALTGLGGPLLLAGLIWQTVRMRSTQSATGLLYVAVILVLFGELISQFLTVTSRAPL